MGFKTRIKHFLGLQREESKELKNFEKITQKDEEEVRNLAKIVKENVKFMNANMFAEDESIRQIANLYNKKYTIVKLLGHFTQMYYTAINSAMKVSIALRSATLNTINLPLKAMAKGTGKIANVAARVAGYEKANPNRSLLMKLRQKTEQIEKLSQKLADEDRILITENNAELERYENLSKITHEQIEQVQKYEENLKKQLEPIDKAIVAIQKLIRDKKTEINIANREIKTEKEEEDLVVSKFE